MPAFQPLLATLSTAWTLLDEVLPLGDPWLLAAGLLAALGAVALYAAAVLIWANRRLERRLTRHVQAPEPERVVARASLAPVTVAAGQLSARLLSAARLDRFRHDLTQAGFYAERHLQLFLAVKLSLALVLGVWGYLLLQVGGGGPRALLVAVPLAVLGFFLPNIWLGRRMRARQAAIARALPDALDLMSIGVSAGLSFDGTMLEITRRWDNELSQELSVVLGDVRTGVGRRQALQHLAERTQLEDLRLLVAALVQADELGTSLAETLAVQAEQLRLRRRQRAEELAHKAATKMLFPMVFLIFPALFIVILGPAIPPMLRLVGGR